MKKQFKFTFAFTLIAVLFFWGVGCKKSSQINSPATMDFTISGSSYINKPINFESNKGNSLWNSFLWDFGDGTTSNKANPTHIFSKWGNHNISLIINSDSPKVVKSISLGFDSIILAKLTTTPFNWHYYTIYKQHDKDTVVTHYPNITFGIQMVNPHTIAIGTYSLDYEGSNSNRYYFGKDYYYNSGYRQPKYESLIYFADKDSIYFVHYEQYPVANDYYLIYTCKM